MPISHSSFSGETNPIDGRIGGEDWDAYHEGTNDWDSVLVKTADQGVTNSATFVSENSLGLSVDTNETWRIEYEIVYTTDATGDIKFEVNVSSGTMAGVFRAMGSDTTANAVLSAVTRIAGTASSPTQTAGGGTLTIHRVLFLEVFVQVTASATLALRFAQNTQTSGQTATIKAGSRMRARLMSSDQTIAAGFINQAATASAPTVS